LALNEIVGFYKFSAYTSAGVSGILKSEEMNMQITCLLKKFYDANNKNYIPMSLDKMALNYEYFCNVVSAALFSQNCNKNVRGLYQKEKPAMGDIYTRFRYATRTCWDKKFVNYDWLDRYYDSVNRLFAKMNEYRFNNNRTYSEVTDKRFICSMNGLMKFVVYARNQYEHEGAYILNDLTEFLAEVYQEMIKAIKMDISDSSEFLIVEGDEAYCLNTIYPIYLYKDVYGHSKKMEKYSIDVKADVLEETLADSKATGLDGAEFILFGGGNISYRRKNMIECYVEPFAIAKYPVTNEEFMQFLQSDPEYAEWRYKNPLFLRHYRAFSQEEKRQVGNCAVYYIGWEDAIRYCNYYSEKIGKSCFYDREQTFKQNNGFKLPTESEWIYAATCGKGDEYTYYPENIVCRNNPGLYGKTVNNTELYENACGVCGMLGNIGEWTNTETTVVTLKKFEKSDNSSKIRKIIMNGSFATDRRNIRYSCGTDVDIDNLHHIGFRMAFKL
jgi:formylglycine-generating enzyme required for sulfatase activity